MRNASKRSRNCARIGVVSRDRYIVCSGVGRGSLENSCKKGKYQEWEDNIFEVWENGLDHIYLKSNSVVLSTILESSPACIMCTIKRLPEVVVSLAD